MSGRRLTSEENAQLITSQAELELQGYIKCLEHGIQFTNKGYAKACEEWMKLPDSHKLLFGLLVKDMQHPDDTMRREP